MNRVLCCPKTIGDVLRARASSNALAYIFLADGTSASEVRWTFADTAKNSAAFAAQLCDKGIGRGDRVILALNPGLEYIAALYGTMRLGAVAVPCFPPFRPKELDRFEAIVLDCSPQGILIDEVYRDQMATLRRRLQSAQREPVVVYGGQRSVTSTESDVMAPGPADTAMLQYTSGSTGSPKGVRLTHAHLVSNCESLGRSMGHDPNRVGMSWLPPYHDMGLIGTIILSMYHGWPLVLMSPAHFVQQPRRWLQAITDYRVSITVGPNFSLDLCADALLDDGTEGLDLSTVREFYCGAEPIFADTLARFERLTAPLGFDANALIPCYGMAEATLFVSGKRAGSRYRTAADPSEPGRVVVSCGEVDSEHTVRIVDPATRRRLDDGLVGEIWVSGPNVAAGYHDLGASTADVFGAKLSEEHREYLRTGDLGFMQSGELFVTGRIKDLIIVDGRNIYPQDVEAAAVRADPALRTAVAFSINGDRSERLCVVAEVEHRDVSADAYLKIVDAIRTSVTGELRVRPHVHICPKRTIPTTTSGKIRRQEARRMFLADGLRPLEIHSSAMQQRRTT